MRQYPCKRCGKWASNIPGGDRSWGAKGEGRRRVKKKKKKRKKNKKRLKRKRFLPRKKKFR